MCFSIRALSVYFNMKTLEEKNRFAAASCTLCILGLPIAITAISRQCVISRYDHWYGEAKISSYQESRAARPLVDRADERPVSAHRFIFVHLSERDRLGTTAIVMRLQFHTCSPFRSDNPTRTDAVTTPRKLSANAHSGVRAVSFWNTMMYLWCNRRRIMSSQAQSIFIAWTVQLNSDMTRTDWVLIKLALDKWICLYFRRNRNWDGNMLRNI